MIKRYLTGILVFLSFSANAAIFDLGNITRDTDTGLDWLDLTETRGMSFDYVSSQFGVGGQFEGWRFATPTEFDQLVTNFGYVPPFEKDCLYGEKYCYSGMDSDDPIIETIIKTLGDLTDAYWDSRGDDETYDVSADGAGGVNGWLAYNRLGNNDFVSSARIYDGEKFVKRTGAPRDDDDLIQTFADAVNSSYESPTHGSYLVRSTVVPAPPAILLLGSALGLLGWLRRKTH